MAVTDPFSLKTIVSGANITDFNQIDTFVLDNKTEKSYTLIDTDGEITLDLSNVANLKVMMFYGTGEFTIRMNDGINDFDLVNPTTLPTILPVSDAFKVAYPTIKILTASTTEVQVNFRAYGEEVAV